MSRDPASSSRHPGRCPLCGRPRDPRYRPFCSRRCRDRDFLNWLDERYRLPAAEDAPSPPHRPEDEEEG